MHDIRAIRETPDAFRAGWARRGRDDADALVAQALELDARLRAAQTAGQEAQTRRNAASKAIGAAKGRKDEAEAARLMASVEADKGVIAEQGEVERTAGGELRDLLAGLPNLPAVDVPDGADEAENVEVGRSGTPGRSNAVVDHVDLGAALGMMDFEAAARMSGSRFVVLKQGLARLERALGQFMLDLQTTEHGYTEVSPPLLVKRDALFGTSQLPKFEEDLFSTISIDWDAVEAASKKAHADSTKELRAELDLLAIRLSEGDVSKAPRISELAAEIARDPHLASIDAYIDASFGGKFRDHHWLIPTAEVSLTNLVREQITPGEQLPLRLTALTHCFRSEAGASGRDTRGMIRQHQFQKCELVSITAPEGSEAEHERMTSCAEAVLERLGLPYRRMLLCAGDMGFSARKTYDLEVWLPSEGRYREISSCSNCGDFQARRMDARTKRAGEKRTEFVHTLNGSGLAVGRTLVAVMETYQQEGGSIAVPEVLVPYMGGVRVIEAGA